MSLTVILSQCSSARYSVTIYTCRTSMIHDDFSVWSIYIIITFWFTLYIQVHYQISERASHSWNKLDDTMLMSSYAYVIMMIFTLKPKCIGKTQRDTWDHGFLFAHLLKSSFVLFVRLFSYLFVCSSFFFDYCAYLFMVRLCLVDTWWP